MKKIKLVLAAVLAFLTLGLSGVQAQTVSHPHYNVKRVLRHKKHVKKHSRRKHAKKRHASRKAQRHHKVVLNTQRYLEKKVGRRHWTCVGGTFGGAHGYTGSNPENTFMDGKGHFYMVYRNGVIKKEKGYKFVTIYRP